MDFFFPASRINLSVDTWAKLMNDPFTIYYNNKFQEFKNIGDDQKAPPGFKKLTPNQTADICIHFRSSFTSEQGKDVGVDLSFLSFVEQAKYEGVIGKIRALFAKIFNWIVRGSFTTPAERCKKLAQELLYLEPILKDKTCKKDFIGAIKAYKRIYEVNDDPKTCMLHECLARWLVSKKPLKHIVKKVYNAEQPFA